MDNTIKGYVHYAKYLKDGKEKYFEHMDVCYDYEQEKASLNSEAGKENLFGYLKITFGAEEIIDFGLKEVKVDKFRTLEGIVCDNGTQTNEDFAVLIGETDINDYLLKTYYGRKVKLTVEFLD